MGFERKKPVLWDQGVWVTEDNRFMGLAPFFSCNKTGKPKILWVWGGYGFSQVWIRTSSTVRNPTGGERRNDQPPSLHRYQLWKLLRQQKILLGVYCLTWRLDYLMAIEETTHILNINNGGRVPIPLRGRARVCVAQPTIPISQSLIHGQVRTLRWQSKCHCTRHQSSISTKDQAYQHTVPLAPRNLWLRTLQTQLHLHQQHESQHVHQSTRKTETPADTFRSQDSAVVSEGGYWSVTGGTLTRGITAANWSDPQVRT